MRSALFPARPRAIAMAVVVSLLAALLSVFAVAAPTNAADSLVSVTAKADRSVLNGAPAEVTLTAKNSSTTPLYNLGYSYRLRSASRTSRAPPARRPVNRPSRR